MDVGYLENLLLLKITRITVYGKFIIWVTITPDQQFLYTEFPSTCQYVLIAIATLAVSTIKSLQCVRVYYKLLLLFI